MTLRKTLICLLIFTLKTGIVTGQSQKLADKAEQQAAIGRNEAVYARIFVLQGKNYVDSLFKKKSDPKYQPPLDPQIIAFYKKCDQQWQQAEAISAQGHADSDAAFKLYEAKNFGGASLLWSQVTAKHYRRAVLEYWSADLYYKQCKLLLE